MKRISLLSLMPLVALTVVACGDKDADDAGDNECGENAYKDADHDHCHCDDGYSYAENGEDCEPDDDGDTDTDAGGDDFSPDDVSAVLVDGDDPVSLLTAKDGQTWLKIENYPGFGGATAPETRVLDEVEINYATCGVCVLLQTGCEPHGDHAHCDATFVPETGGEVTFDAVGGEAGDSWSGSLSGIRFVEVEIGREFETTPIEGGETFTLNNWAFDVVLEAGR